VCIEQVKRLLATAAGAAALAVATAALPSLATAQTASAPAVTDTSNDPPQLVALINDPGADQKARDEAARRLAARTNPDARQQLLNVLNNAGNPRGQQSAAKALAGQTAPDPRFIDPLLALLGSDRALSDAAAQALAEYKSNSTVIGRLFDIAMDPQKHPNARIAATTALGSFPDKRVAKALVDLTSDTTPAVRNAAGDALAAMAGIPENGRDGARWQKWWGNQQGKSDAAFRDEMLVQQSARLNDAQARIQQMAEEIRSIMTDVYRQADANAKDSLLQKWMSSAEPQTRLVAAGFIVEDFQNNQAISQAVKDELRTLVGDSSPAVRLQAAKTIGAITDPAAFNVMLAQLSAETMPDVKAALITVLGAFEDPRAVPVIEKQLTDESLAVAEASAAALAKLGPRLAELEPTKGRELAKTLRQVFDDRGSMPGNEKLRENLVEAMAQLKDPDCLRLFMGLLKPSESEKVRASALRGIAGLRDPNASDVVHGWLKNERVPSLRVEALAALGATSKTEHLPTYFDYFLHDPDPAVREAAWKQFEALLPDADAATLAKWTNQFSPYPEKRVLLYKALAAKYTAAKQLNDLAYTNQNIGDTLMKINASGDQRVANAAEAATYFKLALDYHKEAGSPQNITAGLVDQYLDALLAARKYADATSFVNDMMTTDPGIAGKFRVEADRLRDSKDYDNALKLIGEARKIRGLPKIFADQLKEVETDINRSARQNTGKNGSRDTHTEMPVTAT
jgi:HEAT repeat protein